MSNTYIKFRYPDSKVKRVPENIGKRLPKVVLESIVPIANPILKRKLTRLLFG
jgi:hypothetical protein